MTLTPERLREIAADDVSALSIPFTWTQAMATEILALRAEVERLRAEGDSTLARLYEFVNTIRGGPKLLEWLDAQAAEKARSQP
jgi:hypothetical protein